jgi:hypothetical protein
LLKNSRGIHAENPARPEMGDDTGKVGEDSDVPAMSN